MTVRHIAVLDLWTDANRGDEALQAGLIQLLRTAHPGAHITGVFRFGTNEIKRAMPEIEGSAKRVDEAVGGLRRTHYAAGYSRTRVVGRAIDLVSFVEGLACLVVFRLLGQRSRRLVGAARHRTLTALRDADLVIWKGKNFRQYSGVTAITRALTLTSAAWYTGLLRRELHCINASFWRIEGGMQARLYRAAFRTCRSVTVRDRPSVDNARELLGPRVSVAHCPDLSFAMVGEPVEADSGSDGFDVALTITSWGSKADQERYLQSLEGAVTALRRLGARRFEVIPQVIRAAEDSSRLSAALQRRLESSDVSLIVREGPLSIAELRATYARARMLIGTRMHSCVFARSVGTPFVAVSYDAGPKWDVLTEFWPAELVIDYRDPPARLVEASSSVWVRGQALVRASEPAWARCLEGVDSNVDFVRG